MLTVKAQCNVGNAKEYFEEHLCAGDYYSENRQVTGRWIGRGTEQLNLIGETQTEQFVKLCDNLDPNNGERLTQRTKSTRLDSDATGQERHVANRRVFYDFTLSPPKSVSIAALVANDHRISESHDRAVEITMKELENFAATRVRRERQCSDRITGNIVGATFRHTTSRALDPHLHSHCILFNATFDPIEKRWKALENYHMLQARKFAENVYYHALARDLIQHGYQIENSPRGDFQITGISSDLCQKFSKRHQEIDAHLKDLLQKNPALASGNLKDVRENLAQSKRARKVKGIREEVLQEMWQAQLSETDRRSLSRLTQTGPSAASHALNASTALARAEEHVFDRKSVVRDHDLWSHALEFGRGSDIDLTELKQATATGDYIRPKEDIRKLTKRAVLERELSVVLLARDGARTCRAFCQSSDNLPTELADDQRQAAEKILKSRDFVTLFRGGAGTGKSFALRAVKEELLRNGHSVRVLAPQRQQVIDLQRSGLGDAKTISEFLTKNEFPSGSVLLIDEAGQIGAKQMHRLLELAKSAGGRVILSGDTRQHGAVEGSDALRAIEKYAGLFPAELQQIRRQDPDLGKTQAEKRRIAEYRKAVREASEGKLWACFNRLNAMNAIVQCTTADQQARIAKTYLDLVSKNQSTVVVSQTWAEVHRLNEQIRADLKQAQLVGQKDSTVAALEPVDLTDAQKKDPRFYSEHAVAVFNRDVAGFRKGEVARLNTITGDKVILENDDKIRGVPFKHLDRVSIFQQKELKLASGDRLQLKANHKAVRGQALANGELVTVRQVRDDGVIELQDGRLLPPAYREFIRGYAVTSYGSQGKTVDHVLFSDSMVKTATNSQQWYVSISRGRKGISIFTTDKAQLRENAARSGDRELAMELVNETVGSRVETMITPKNEKRSSRLRAFLRGIEIRRRAWLARRRNPGDQNQMKGLRI